MSINLTTKMLPYVDEMFATESKLSLITNNDFNWSGAHTVSVNKVNTVAMSDYDRAGTGNTASRYGAYGAVENTLEEFTLANDRSFTFIIDKLDNEETGGVLDGAKALARQQREVIIPEVDAHVYGVVTANAGTTVDTVTLTSDNIYGEIIKGSNELDNNEVPETGRVLIVTPDTYLLMKQSSDIVMNTDIGEDMRLKGVIAHLDGLTVLKVPASRLPNNFGFLITHPVACVAPVKLEDYKIHNDPPGISGALVEGRICYDAFVLDNKINAIYYEENKPASNL